MIIIHYIIVLYYIEFVNKTDILTSLLNIHFVVNRDIIMPYQGHCVKVLFKYFCDILFQLN